jgi:CHRD domain-containing protein
MKKLALAVSAVALVVFGGIAAHAVGAGSADVFTYRAVLNAGAEVPKPTAPKGAGGLFTSTITKDGSTYTITWKLTYRRLSGPAVAAHVHRGRVGVTGSVLVPLCGPCRRGQTGKATIKKAAADAMLRGAAYVNVHTRRNADGEIRGQARLTGTTSGTSTDPPATEPPPASTYDPY